MTANGAPLQSPSPPLAEAVSRWPAPSDTLAIVFTDIENSTALWETAPEAMRVALQMHDDLLRAKIHAYQAYEVKIIGDGFMIAFHSAMAAWQWCVDVQDALLHADWPHELTETPFAQEQRDSEGRLVFRGLKVRMSAHWGSPISLVNSITGRMEYIGPMVHRTARAISVAKGGQMVVTSDLLAQARHEVHAHQPPTSVTREDDQAADAAPPRGPATNLDADFDIKDLGKHQLKGLSDGLHLYLVTTHPLRGRLEHAAAPSNSTSDSLWRWISG